MAGKKAQREPRRLGNYDLHEKVGGGGCGSVFRACHAQTGEIVAVKVLKPELADHELLIKRFEQEFLATRVLDNPHIVRALDFGRDTNSIYLVMEFVDGKDLWAYLEERGRLSEAEAVALIEQIAQALDEAHEQGMIHRDVKPDNILLKPDGTAKLTDFGLVKDLGSELNLTDATDILGTPNFMAPEQFDDPTKVDRRCDVYSLAATLYMLVTAELPFRAANYLATMQKKLRGELVRPRKLAPELSEHFERAILAALSIHPNKRPDTCLEFIKQLKGESESFADDEPPTVAEGNGIQNGVPAAVVTERRTAVRYKYRLECCCRALGSERRTRWKARIRNISVSGVAVEASRRYEPGAILLLDLWGADREIINRLVVVVVRVEKAMAGRWLLGCRLACSLTHEDLQVARAAAATRAAQTTACRKGR